MSKYIKRIIAENFRDQGTLVWDLQPDVNVLVGANGRGKSTLMRLLFTALSHVETSELTPDTQDIFRQFGRFLVLFSDGSSVEILENQRTVYHSNTDDNGLLPINMISTFDVPSEGNILDSSLQSLIYQGFRGFEISILKQMKAKFEEYAHGNGIPSEEVAAINGARTSFIRILADVLNDTDKRFDDNILDDISPILKGDHRIDLKDLSSGEKQMLILLFTALIQNRNPVISILDEPEISLHIEWQRKLIDYLHEINPNAQLIIVTHSPTIYFMGWGDKMQRMGDLFQGQDVILPEDDEFNSEAALNDAVSVFSINFRNKADKRNTYSANKFLNEYTIMTLAEGEAFLRCLAEYNLVPDRYSFYLTAERIHRFEDIKTWIQRMEDSGIDPDIRIYNALLKRARTFADGWRIIQSLQQNMAHISLDIYSVSYLLTKTTRLEQVNQVEELRSYYNISDNDHYRKKLAAKRSLFTGK